MCVSCIYDIMGTYASLHIVGTLLPSEDIKVEEVLHWLCTAIRSQVLRSTTAYVKTAI